MSRAPPARSRPAALGAATLASALALLLALAPPPARAGALPGWPTGAAPAAPAPSPAPSPGLKRVGVVASLWPKLLGEDVLRPNEPLTGQLIKLDGAAKRYRLRDLKPSADYEVRVSYPASIPASLAFEWSGVPAPDAAAPGRAATRRLLDTDKAIFSTDADGGGPGGKAPLLLLKAARRSVHKDGPEGGPDQLVFDIVLAELWFGVLPKDTLPVIVAAGIALLAALLLAPIWAGRLFPALVNWVTAGRGGAPSPRRRASPPPEDGAAAPGPSPARQRSQRARRAAP
ncbi:hypothetical protein Rsub_02722 [Raphidocelis subcapitata]|uniref:Uncharacterized protein n=1 Tax=Raphidocelis subcapitata TaxID=307507 RepID=A0A2V0NQT5_9CHLO|nr:hypothetical protein Rsub_02722 [Raphidocelis subcapitata]|eukprot:GBF90016.1 hypothetical protein Rsub_02722 [Raphidocelis subcapitata]